MKNAKGIRERILAAGSIKELDELADEFGFYKNASKSTINRVRKAHSLRLNQLRKAQATKKGN